MRRRRWRLWWFLALFWLALPAPVSAQATDDLLAEAACRENPHGEDCICAEVTPFAYFPKRFAAGLPADTNGDTRPPELVDGVWMDRYGNDLYLGGALEKEKGVTSDLVYTDNRVYGEHCAMAYFREDLRRLWYFAVALGATFMAASLAWMGVVHMQNSASAVDLSRTRGMLLRVILGVVILASALVVWEAVSGFLFLDREAWTLERGIFFGAGH